MFRGQASVVTLLFAANCPEVFHFYVNFRQIHEMFTTHCRGISLLAMRSYGNKCIGEMIDCMAPKKVKY